MQRIRPTVQSTRKTSARVGAGCLLLLFYLAAATPLGPLLIAGLAEFDRGHQIAIQQSAQGLQILLQHDCVRSSKHRHGVVARALTVFAERSSAPQADHVIQFSSTDVAEEISLLAARPIPDLPSPNEKAADYFVACAPPLALAAFPRPPPIVTGLLLASRSTVLLI